MSNLGQRKWPAGWDTEPAIRLSYHWVRDGQTVIFDGLRTALTHPVSAGGDTELTAQVLALDDPESTGRSTQLVFDIVAVGDRRFGTDAAVTVQISAGPKAALLTERGVDDLVPLDAVLRMRSELAFPGVIERALVEEVSTAALPDGLDGIWNKQLTAGWVVDHSGLAVLEGRYLSERPDVVVEFGSGASTVLLARLARRSGCTGMAVISFEQDPVTVQLTVDLLRELGLYGLVQVVIAPLSSIELDDMCLRCYCADTVAGALLGQRPEMVVINSPTAVENWSRYPIVPILRRHLTTRATFVLMAAWRDLELTVAER